MTLIAFACREHEATIVTDTLAYRSGCASIGHTSKVLALPHLDAVVAGQGDSEFTCSAEAAIRQLSIVRDFDQLVEEIPALLTAIWAMRTADLSATARIDGTIFLIGYSPAAERFCANGFASDDAFTPFTIDDASGPWVMPAPWGNRPSFIEEARVRRDMVGDDKAQRLVDEWAAREPIAFDDVATVEGWTQLAFLIRHSRALNQFCKNPIGGKVIATQLTHGCITMVELFEFDDDGEEFDQLVSGTLHPRGLAGPCPCGSGDTFRDCHIAQRLDEPCSFCSSGEPLRDCCMAPRPAGDGVDSTDGSTTTDHG